MTVVQRVVSRLMMLVVLAVTVFWLCAGVAVAASPWWHMLTLSAPPHAGTEEGEVLVDAANLGDAPASDKTHPVVIEDTLPAGVQVTGAHPEGGGSGLGYGQQYEHASCSQSGQTVKCTYPLPILAYEEAIVVIDVKAAPGAGTGVNEATVSGGLLPSETQNQQLALEGPPSYGIAHLEVQPEEEGGTPATRAASHPFQLTTTFALNTQAVPIVNGLGIHKLSLEPLALTKDTVFHLPPGLVGNATSNPKCSEFVFTQQVDAVPGFKCPDDTVMGVATSIVTENRPVSPEIFVSPLYNLEPAYGEPARFGFRPPVHSPVVLDTAVNVGGGDTGVTVSTRDITQLAAFIGAQVTFWGWPADPRHDSQRGECVEEGDADLKSGKLSSCPLSERAPKPFLTLPASCTEPLATVAEADSWELPGGFAAATATPPIPAFQACNQVPFSPTIKAETSADSTSGPSGLDFDVNFNDEGLANPEGVAQSQLQKTIVTLPEGMTINPSAGSGLAGCTPSDYARETVSSTPGEGCPNESKLGTVTIETPLLSNVIHGSVFIAQPYENPFHSLVALYVVAKNPQNGILVKLPGKVTPDPLTGRLTTTFENIPQLPFAHFNFHFREGQQAPLVTPSTCGTYVVEAELFPWSTPTSPVGETWPFAIDKGFNGGECPAAGAPPFAPRIISGTQNNSAGTYSQFYLRILRNDNEQEITRFTTTLPEGLTANLTGIPFCPDRAIEQARTATGSQETSDPSCPAASEIGHTLVGAGVGTVLAWTPGKLYLAGPYHGSALSLVSVTSATVGPFDLGTVVIRFALRINPLTAQAEIDANGSDAIPHIIDGIVAHVRDIHVYVDRKKFMINPTSCQRKAVEETITGAGADPANPADRQMVHASAPFQAADCAALAFKPRFTATTSGRTSRANGAALTVNLTYPKNPNTTQANLRTVKVSLPKQLPSRLPTLKRACTGTVFNENPAACPAASRVGMARAITPILPEPLAGPAYFVSHGGAEFPELVIVLQGYGLTIDLHGQTFITKGVTSSTFHAVPDQPVTSFRLTLPQGQFSALAANTNLCRVTNTIAVSKTRRVSVHGHEGTVTRTTKKLVRGSLLMPTTFIAQNGAEIHQDTIIKVNGCPRASKRSHHPHKKKK